MLTKCPVTADSVPHKRHRATLPDDGADDYSAPLPIDLAASLISGVSATVRPTHRMALTTTSAPQLTPESPIRSTALTAPTNPSTYTRRQVEVEVPTMHQIRALRANAEPEEVEGLQKPSPRPLKRMRSITKILPRDQRDLSCKWQTS